MTEIDPSFQPQTSQGPSCLTSILVLTGAILGLLASVAAVTADADWRRSEGHARLHVAGEWVLGMMCWGPVAVTIGAAAGFALARSLNLWRKH
jgi:hypothetical protein